LSLKSSIPVSVSGIPADASDRFTPLLTHCVADYFRKKKCGPRGGRQMRIKIFVGYSWLILSYAAMLVVSNKGGFVALYLLHGLAQLYLLLNVGHDANHGTASAKSWVNRSLSFTMDICGLSSRLWRIAHHDQHHKVVNIGTLDDALSGRGCLRFSPHASTPRLAAYQHIYALPLYGLSTLDYLFLRDFRLQLRHQGDDPVWNWAILLLSKACYIFVMIVLPTMITGRSVLMVLLVFFLTHLSIGFGALLLFQVTHILSDSSFPSRVPDTRHRVAHIFATTADFAHNSILFDWVAGGLHTHIIHHLFPGVCHTHYRALTPFVIAAAAESGQNYRSHPTLLSALKAHLRHLRAMGRPLEDARAARKS
jgi:linoleoyl-CoA desaturase